MKWSRYLRKYFWLRGERLHKARSWLVPRLLLALNTVLMRTLRITTSGKERTVPYLDEPCATGALFVTWHDLSLTLVHMFRHKNIGVLMSRSRWGQLQAAFWRLSGFPTVWGSSKKREGIQALREAIRLLRTGQSFAFTPDGPKGPRHEAQPGVIFMASHTPTVIMAVGIAASSAWRLPTWDRYMIPKPFARVHVHIGEALKVPPNLSRDEMQHWRTTLEQALNEAEAVAIEAVTKNAKA
ncbi:MAG TPA: lysophospholipid acyltransferase family protein [Abditibacteriaceae bacterium]|nr:lysophospholipid acyltransferase family protein [Abditibacteriaceae bacterium]